MRSDIRHDRDRCGSDVDHLFGTPHSCSIISHTPRVREHKILIEVSVLTAVEPALGRYMSRIREYALQLAVNTVRFQPLKPGTLALWLTGNWMERKFFHVWSRC